MLPALEGVNNDNNVQAKTPLNRETIRRKGDAPHMEVEYSRLLARMLPTGPLQINSLPPQRLP
jgi:hypothetical protein